MWEKNGESTVCERRMERDLREKETEVFRAKAGRSRKDTVD